MNKLLLSLAALVLLTATLPADAPRQKGIAAAVKVKGSPTIAPLEMGTKVWEDSDRYRWTEISKRFRKLKFTQFESNHQGVTAFEVRSAGKVRVAVTSRWGGGGNASGGWTKQLTTKDAFEEAGWREIGKLQESGGPRHGYHWLVYERSCEAGEKFKLRTEKYCAPILLF